MSYQIQMIKIIEDYQMFQNLIFRKFLTDRYKVLTLLIKQNILSL